MLRGEKKGGLRRRRMRVAVLVVEAMLFAGLMSGSASADHQTKNGGVHWGRYRWANTVVSTERIFWLFDR